MNNAVQCSGKELLFTPLPTQFFCFSFHIMEELNDKISYGESQAFPYLFSQGKAGQINNMICSRTQVGRDKSRNIVQSSWFPIKAMI